MSTYPRKINRAAAERLLNGEPADPRLPRDPLAVLLAYAAAPAQEGELAGEEAAVAAFRGATPAGALTSTMALPTAGRAYSANRAGSARPLAAAPDAAEQERPRQFRPARKALRHPMEVAVLAALTATAAGGIALAAGTAGPFRAPPDRGSAEATATLSNPAGTGKPGAGRTGSPASPHPSTVGLCQAYTAGAGSAQGKMLDNPAFSSLIEAAGGKEKVAGYCARVLADRPGKHKGKGRDKGKGRPSAKPTPTHADPSNGNANQSNGNGRPAADTGAAASTADATASASATPDADGRRPTPVPPSIGPTTEYRHPSHAAGGRAVSLP